MAKTPPPASRRPLPEPVLGAGLQADLGTADRYFASVETVLRSFGPPSDRSPELRGRAHGAKTKASAVREDFFRRHAAEIYDDLTGGCTKPLRVAELIYAAAQRYPRLLPTRAEIDRERTLKLQYAKEGRELDQGLFVAQVLADPRCGLHLIHAMLRPRRESQQRLAEFRRTGRLDLGSALVERRDNVGTVTLTNSKFLNAEDDGAVLALETATDLVLLDDRIEVCVLRGSVVEHPKYAGGGCSTPAST